MAKSFARLSSKEILDYFRKLDRKTQKKLLLALGGGLVFIVFVLWPAWIKRPQMEAQIKILRSQIQLGRVRIAQEPKLLAERKEHEAFVKEAQSRLLKEEEREGIVGILAGIAEKSQVTLLSTEPQDQDQTNSEKIPAPFDSKYRKISYLVTVEGGYHQWAAFVSAVENHSKIFRVSESSISPKEETPRIHLGQVLISAFALRDQTKAGR